MLRLHDLEWLGERLNPFPRENRWSEMAAQIPEDKIDLFATVADYASLPAAIEARYGGYADSVMLQISDDEDLEALGECVRAIQKIPSRFKSYRATWD